MKTSTVYCYDRYAHLKRLAVGLGVVLGVLAGALATMPARALDQHGSVPTQARPAPSSHQA